MSSYSTFPTDKRGRKFAKVINCLRLGRDDLARAVLSDVDQQYWDDIGKEVLELDKRDFMAYLLPPFSDPRMEVARKLLYEVFSPHKIHFLDLLLPAMDTDGKDQALRQACAYGDVEVVRTIIAAGADPHHEFHSPLQSACMHGHAHIVKELIVGIEPGSLHDMALGDGVSSGQLEIVAMLAPLSTPQSISFGLGVACMERHIEIIDYLYALCPKEEIAKMLNSGPWEGSELVQQRWNADRQRERLAQELHNHLNDDNPSTGRGLKL